MNEFMDNVTQVQPPLNTGFHETSSMLSEDSTSIDIVTDNVVQSSGNTEQTMNH